MGDILTAKGRLRERKPSLNSGQAQLEAIPPRRVLAYSMLMGNRMSELVTTFVERLTSASPQLTAVREQHVEDHGELLPHVLMGDITRFVIARSGDESAEWVTDLLQHMESGLVSGNRDIAELVSVSFVENLSGETAVIAALLPEMGDALRKEVKATCGR